MLKAFKYRIYPNNQQIQILNRHFGCVRYIYNKGLETKIKEYESTGKSSSCFQLTTGMLKQEKENNPWLKNTYSQCLQMSLRNLDNAFTSFFREKKGFPKFKSKKNPVQSIQYPQNIKVNFENNKIKVPKIGEIKTVFSREFEGKIKTVTISKTSTNKFFVSILIDNEIEIPKKHKIEEKSTVGIDLGIKDFCITSNGEKVGNPRFLKSKIDRLKVLQHRKDKKKRGGTRRYRLNKKVAKLHEDIRNSRNDFLHKLSTKLISENKTICLEDLNVKGMMKNHCLAQSISDVSWSKFVEYLNYKSEWYGNNIIQIGRFEASSKTCSNCGWIKKDLILKDRVWKCESCDKGHDRDLNAALNIKKFGLIQHSKYSGLGQPGVPVEASSVEEPMKRKESPCGWVVQYID